MKVKIKGYTTLTGNPVAIVRLMAEARYFDDLGGDEYIENVKQTAWRCFGIPLQVAGATYAERAKSLLHEMAKNNMIDIEEE